MVVKRCFQTRYQKRLLNLQKNCQNHLNLQKTILNFQKRTLSHLKNQTRPKKMKCYSNCQRYWIHRYWKIQTKMMWDWKKEAEGERNSPGAHIERATHCR